MPSLINPDMLSKWQQQSGLVWKNYETSAFGLFVAQGILAEGVSATPIFSKGYSMKSTRMLTPKWPLKWTMSSICRSSPRSGKKPKLNQTGSIRTNLIGPFFCDLQMAQSWSSEFQTSKDQAKTGQDWPFFSSQIYMDFLLFILISYVQPMFHILQSDMWCKNFRISGPCDPILMTWEQIEMQMECMSSEWAGSEFWKELMYTKEWCVGWNWVIIECYWGP